MEPTDGFKSRKFITTQTGMYLGIAALVFGSLADAPESYWSALPPFFILQAAGIAAYNWANLRQSQNGSAPR